MVLSADESSQWRQTVRMIDVKIENRFVSETSSVCLPQQLQLRGHANRSQLSTL